MNFVYVIIFDEAVSLLIFFHFTEGRVVCVFLWQQSPPKWIF